MNVPTLSRRKRRAFVAIIALAPPLLLVLGLEGAGRLYMWLRHGVPGKSYGLYRSDPELGAVQRVHAYNSNSETDNWGFRGIADVREEKTPGTLRVYASGGSTTYCYNLSTGDAWPAMLQRKLRRRPGHAADEVLNAGQICFSLAHEYRLARRFVPRLHPDVVVLYTAINEPMNAGFLSAREGVDLDDLLAERQWNVAARALDQASWPLRHSLLARYWHYYVAPRLAKPGPVPTQESDVARDAMADESTESPRPHPWIRYNFLATLREYLAFVIGEGARPIVVRWGDGKAHADPGLLVMRQLRDDAVAVARAAGAEVCDAASAMEARPDRASLFLNTGVHVTHDGAEVLSDIVLGCILAPPAEI